MLVGRILAAALLTLALCVSPPEACGQGWFSWGADQQAEPGTAAWWKANKKKATFVPGSGYQVPGVEGFFDENGRSITAPVDEITTAALLNQQEETGLLPGLDPKSGIKRMKAAAGYGPSEDAARQALAEGEQLFKEKKYAAAAKKLRAAVDRYPQSLIAERALFLLAESYFWQDEYIDARDAYDELVALQPNSREMDTVIERQWKIAQYWEKYYFEYKQDARLKPNLMDKTRPTFDTIGHAIKTYDSIRLNDPTGPRADDAIMAQAGIYFRRGRYYDADAQYSLLRREYPRSEHQFQAHILGLQAKLQMYQGPQYDGTPLEEAKVLLKQIHTQFAGRLTDDEKKRLRQVQAEVQLAVETRALRLAKYYEGTEHNDAAMQIYRHIAVDHRGSPIAKQAAEKIAELGEKPGEPAPKLAWFVDLFPENRERSRYTQLVEQPRASDTRFAENPSSDQNVTPASATTTR